jgi:hypothetical protein
MSARDCGCYSEAAFKNELPGNAAQFDGVSLKADANGTYDPGHYCASAGARACLPAAVDSFTDFVFAFSIGMVFFLVPRVMR